jgi:hypothetical protein
LDYSSPVGSLYQDGAQIKAPVAASCRDFMSRKISQRLPAMLRPLQAMQKIAGPNAALPAAATSNQFKAASALSTLSRLMAAPEMIESGPDTVVGI